MKSERGCFYPVRISADWRRALSRVKRLQMQAAPFSRKSPALNGTGAMLTSIPLNQKCLLKRLRRRFGKDTSKVMCKYVWIRYDTYSALRRSECPKGQGITTMHSNNHRITQKAKGAIETLAKIYAIEKGAIRTDRAAIKQLYLELEENSYRWIASKQEWAYVGDNEPVYGYRVAHFITGIVGLPIEEGAYIFTEGLKAAGYKILAVEIIVPLGGDETPMLHVDVEL